MTIYGRLGFTFNDPANTNIQNLSSTVQNQIALMPPFLKNWQAQDLQNSAVGGYFNNPVANVTQNIRNAANIVQYYGSIATNTNTTLISLLQYTANVANSISNTSSPNFLYHTNRMSNMVPVGNDTANSHYITSIGLGKMLMYLTNQVESVPNNSPMLGSFTSIMIGNTLNTLNSTFSATSIALQQSITPVTNVTNLSFATAQTLANTANTIYLTLTSFRQNDINFYKNSQNVMTDFTTIRQFSTIGQTETFLLNNFIGTANIITRLSSS